MSGSCVIVGAGGHASVMIEALMLQGKYRAQLALTLDWQQVGRSIFGVPIEQEQPEMADLLELGMTHFANGVGSIGDNQRRREVFERYERLGLKPATVIHPDSVLSPSTLIEDGACVFAGAIVNPGAKLQSNVVINTGAIIEHDCSIGEHAFVGPGARIAGNVQVGAEVFIGIGATVIQGLRIGRGARIGAGAVVLRDVAAGETVVGIAREISA